MIGRGDLGGALLRLIAPVVMALAIAGIFRMDLAAQNNVVAPPQPPAPGRTGAPIDLTGNWVSVVTEDWIYRMLTPRRGDYMSVPVNDEGRKLADGWDLARDNAAGLQCKAFGAAALMRTPTRLQITWQDDDTLKVDADNGTQTRLLHFAPGGKRQPLLSLAVARPAGEPTWQGYSVAEWEALTPRGVFGGVGGRIANPPTYPAKGNLKVITTGMRAGYLRANGVPYSESTVLTETFDRLTGPNGEEWLLVNSIVEDPTYLFQPYITSSHFKKEPDASKWRPTPCETPAPTR